MPEPNPAQRDLIDGHEGMYVVDAGPGTGKTFAITRRYGSIIRHRSVEPRDVLLLTFTNTAAEEMRERIIATCEDATAEELYDAPIQTFHSLCNDLLHNHGLTVPRHLGIDDAIAQSTTVLEEAGLERLRFREFFDRFVDDHPEHTDYIQLVRDESTLLALLHELAAKGIVPTKSGWYRNSREALEGDFSAFKNLFDEQNEQPPGTNRQSPLRSALTSYDNGCYVPDAPSRSTLRGEGKRVPDETAHRAFESDREALIAFVHDLYIEYLEFALARDYLNFGMLQVFAFVLLCENHDLRDRLSFRYTMIDEFQDTSEIQFKLALLLQAEANLCVVGDWKQSIYSFQYADVENILSFERRLCRYRDQLNDDHQRVELGTDPPQSIELTRNYRSTQPIIDFCETVFSTPATAGEADSHARAHQDRVVSLEAARTPTTSAIEAIYHEDEPAAVLSQVQAIVGNEEYRIHTDGETRVPTYGDIAVLSRTHQFGREVVELARRYDIPVTYDGGIELFDTDQAKLLLAWLRIIEGDRDAGWAVVLEQAGYTIDAIDHALETGERPAAMLDFAQHLQTVHRVESIARAVFDRYGFDDAISDELVTTLAGVADHIEVTRGDVIRFIEEAIDAGWTREVDTGGRGEALSVQTIHAVKGLEFPIVIMANMNRHQFPTSGHSGGSIIYRDPIGLRAKHVIDDGHDRPYRYDNWRYTVLNHALPRTYDEERRLLYVALSRAKDHLVLTAGETPNTFFEELPVSPESTTPSLAPAQVQTTTQLQLGITIPEMPGPVGLSAHDLMDEAVFTNHHEGRGKAYGRRIHDFAERYVSGEAVEATEPDEHEVAAYLGSKAGKLEAEVPIYLPLTVGDERVTISGVVDLIHRLPDRIELVDFKTDRTRTAHEEYRKQLSVYYHVLAAANPDRPVEVAIFYTADGDHVPVTPLEQDEIRALTDQALDDRMDGEPRQ